MSLRPSFLLAPNAFKGTIDAERAAELMEGALLTRYPNAKTKKIPIADGGDGTCYLLGMALSLQKREATALDALGRPVSGFFFLDESNRTAYLDVSTVSGIKHLQHHERSPWITSTYGTGELINAAISLGTEHIVLGLGGSASIDLGTGILQALGYLFLDKNGRELTAFSDHFIGKIRHIQAPMRKPKVRFTCLCDVRNFFFGAQGAIPVFGPQKGLGQDELPTLEAEASRLIALFAAKTEVQVGDKPGYGAAGGIAFGLSFFFPVDMEMGATWFFGKVSLEQHLKATDWVLTGEGKYDGQSESGKGCYELLQLAKKHQRKIAILSAGSGDRPVGFDKWIPLPDLDPNQGNLRERAEKSLLEALDKADWD